MKTIYHITFLFILILNFIPGSIRAQEQTTGVDTTLIVNGVCEMCRITIERASYLDGVSIAEWDVDSKLLTLTFDPSKTDLEAINTAINNAGYDTEYSTADEEAYQGLHKCCHYRDPEVIKEHSN